MNKLPTLPHGMGVYDYVRDKIRYRKSIKVGSRSVRVSVMGDSIQEVNRLMNEKEKEYSRKSRADDIQARTMTLEHAMGNWLILYKKEQVNEKSYDRIESTFNNHIKGTSLGRLKETDITSDDIQRHLKTIDLSYSSIKKVYELLNQYFKYRFRREPLMNPMIGVSKPKNKDDKPEEELTVWNDEEMIALSNVAFEPYKAGISGFKHGLAIVFVMWSFIRIGEAMGLKWKDIDIENRTIDIKRQLSRVRDRDNVGYKSVLKETKYKSSRKFKMSNMAYDCISEYKRRKGKVSPDDFILEVDGKVLSEQTITNSYKAMIKAAKLPENKHVTIHGLRHSGISYMLRHGVPVEVVSKMAGHKSIQVTLNTYYSVLEEQKNDAMDKFNTEFDVLKKGAN